MLYDSPEGSGPDVAASPTGRPGSAARSLALGLLEPGRPSWTRPVRGPKARLPRAPPCRARSLRAACGPRPRACRRARWHQLLRPRTCGRRPRLLARRRSRSASERTPRSRWESGQGGSPTCRRSRGDSPARQTFGSPLGPGTRDMGHRSRSMPAAACCGEHLDPRVVPEVARIVTEWIEVTVDARS